jgi:leader peptidase (prepilin peptidase)/N-methyltransferase
VYAPAVAWPLALLAFALGAVVGSFLNVCIVRWPEGESVVRPPSRCPTCGRGVRWFENVPILGWLALRGRCAGCGERISALYPLVELTVALGWLACALFFGATLDALRVAVFGTVLLGIAATDARRYVIPDGFTVFLLLFAIVTAVVSRGGGAELTLFAQPYEALVGACTGAGAIAIIGWFGEMAFKKEAMGFGDVTMMAGVGAVVGPERALLTVIVGAFVGAVASVTVLVPMALVARRRAAAAGGDVGALELPPVPFGVFLAPAALLTLLFGDRMIAWYFAHVLQ